MTILEALQASIANVLEEFLDYLYDLIHAREKGQGGQLWAEFQRLFLSRREEKANYAFTDPVVLEGETVEFGAFGFGEIGDTVEIIDIERGALAIHARRGREAGILSDVKRMCNTATSTMNYHPQSECGWILDVTSPEFTPELELDPDTALTYFDLDNMLDITTPNNSSRSDDEVKEIIRHDIVPLKTNVRVFFT